MKNLLINKKEFYNKIYILSNCFLVFSIIIFSIYLVAPLIGGKLLISALKGYGSWILVALGARILSQRARKGEKIMIQEYILGCILVVIYFILRFSYPYNIIFSFMAVVIMGISWRAQQRARDKDET